MSIASFIRDTILRPRLLKAGCMVVYDPDRRYQAICASLADEKGAFLAPGRPMPRSRASR